MKNSFHCTFCDGNEDSLSDFQKHIVKHKKGLLCEADPKNCHYVARGEIDLINHTQENHASIAHPFVCRLDNCRASRGTLEWLRIHIVDEHPWEDVAAALARCGIEEEAINALLGLDQNDL